MANKKCNKLYIGNRLTIDSNVEPEGFGRKDMWLATKRDLEDSLNDTNRKVEIGQKRSDIVLKIKEVSEKPLCIQIKNSIREDLSEHFVEISRVICAVKSNLSNVEVNRVINNLYLIGIQEFWGNILFECAKKMRGSIDLVNDGYDKKLLRIKMPKIKVERISFSESEESFKNCFDKNMRTFVKNEICLPIEIISDKRYKKFMQRYNSAFKRIFTCSADDSLNSVEDNPNKYKKSSYTVLNEIKSNLHNEIVYDKKIQELRNVYYGFSFDDENALEKWKRILNNADQQKTYYQKLRDALDANLDGNDEGSIDDIVFAFVKNICQLKDNTNKKVGLKVKKGLILDIDRSSSVKVNDIRNMFMDALAFYLFVNNESIYDDFEKSKSELSMLIQKNRVFRFLFELVKWCDSNFEDGNILDEYYKEAKEDFGKRYTELGLGINAVESMIGKQYFLSTFGIFGMSKRKCSDYFKLYDIPMREVDSEENNYDVKVGEYAKKVKGTISGGYLMDKRKLDVLHNNRMLFGRLLSYGYNVDKLMDIHKYDSIDYSAGRYLRSIKGVTQNENRVVNSVFKTSDTMSLYDKKKNCLYASMLHNYCDILEILEDEIAEMNEGDVANVEKYSNLYYEKNGEPYLKIDEFMKKAREDKRSVIERYEEADNKLAESFFYLDWDCKKILEILLKVLRKNSK